LYKPRNLSATSKRRRGEGGGGGGGVGGEEGGKSPRERVDYEDTRNLTPLFTAENKAENNADITRQIKQAQAIKRE
jgi:hypothetical protein